MSRMRILSVATATTAACLVMAASALAWHGTLTCQQFSLVGTPVYLAFSQNGVTYNSQNVAGAWSQTIPLPQPPGYGKVTVVGTWNGADSPYSYTTQAPCGTPPPPPQYACTALGLNASGLTATATVAVSASNGASFASDSIAWGDSSQPTSSSSLTQTHTYTSGGTYTISATVTFNLPNSTTNSVSCSGSVTVTPPPPKCLPGQTGQPPNCKTPPPPKCVPPSKGDYPNCKVPHKPKPPKCKPVRVTLTLSDRAFNMDGPGAVAAVAGKCHHPSLRWAASQLSLRHSPSYAPADPNGTITFYVVDRSRQVKVLHSQWRLDGSPRAGKRLSITFKSGGFALAGHQLYGHHTVTDRITVEVPTRR